MKRWFIGLLAVALAAATTTSAFAQGGGASSTGTIQGRVTDSQGAVLPGVTVIATSPSALGAQTAVTSETGNYRFPAVPPGVYTVTYELAGFNTVRREGIQLSLGFTANVNIELALATLQETVTVTGESPVIDTSATRVQQNFKVEQLMSIPNGRDMWALLAVTPSVQMTRIDVGGNRAGTQTGYSAYGMTGQVRVLIEGINTTEGTGGAGFYFDYSSLDEAFLGTSGQSAEMPNPGVQSQFIARSGGNQFSGEYYLDWYNNALQSSNIPDSAIARGVRKGGNEIDKYYDTAINMGGPIVKDKLWWFGTYRQQSNAVAQPTFQGALADKTFDTKLWNPIGKLTYQANQNNKIIGYYQWGQKLQPNRLPFGTYTYTDEQQTNKQDSGSWVYKGGVERHRQRQALLRGPLRGLRLLLPALGQRQRRLLLARHRARRSWMAPTSSGSSTATASRSRRRPPTSSTRRAWARTPSSSVANSSGRRAGKATSSAGAATATSSTPTA